MNREQRRAEQETQSQKTKPIPPKQAGTQAPSRRPFAFWMVSVFAAFGVLFGLWSLNAAPSAAAKANPIASSATPSVPAPLAAAPSSFAPNFAASVPSVPDVPLMGGIDFADAGNLKVVKANDLKKGDKVWHNGKWLVVASVKHETAKVTPEPAPSPQPILEADLDFDLSQSNGGKTFDVGRIAPCSEKVVRTNGTMTTAGELKVGDTVCMTGNTIGRVVKVEKKWHTPTPPKYDKNGNGFNRVIATTKRMTDRILYLYTSVELVKTTPEHPFSVKGKGFVEAGRLQPGDVLETQDGKVVSVERTEARNEPQLVYNLEVENAHNFFVGKNAMLVHNGGDCVPDINWNPKSIKTWGHTFNTHGAGAKNTQSLIGRAASTGSHQGQWLNNEAAAEMLKGYHGANEPFSIVKLPEGMGQIIHPNGSITPATRATIVPKPGGGFRTGYPVP